MFCEVLKGILKLRNQKKRKPKEQKENSILDPGLLVKDFELSKYDYFNIKVSCEESILFLCAISLCRDFNLEKKIEALPSLSLEEFQEKKKQQRTKKKKIDRTKNNVNFE